MALATLPPVAIERGSTQFLMTVDPAEKRRWKAAADTAGVSMAEYVRRAVASAADAPSAAEIADARALAAKVRQATLRIEAMLDRTIGRIEAVLDPAAEDARRAEILAGIETRGERLDLTLLARG